MNRERLAAERLAIASTSNEAVEEVDCKATSTVILGLEVVKLIEMTRQRNCVI